MYAQGLGWPMLGSFRGHQGFDGIMVGPPDASYHLEFTSQQGHAPLPAPSPEHLLVLYLPDAEAWQIRCTAMTTAGFIQVASENPYWDAKGRTYEDIEGYRVVIQHAAWGG